MKDYLNKSNFVKFINAFLAGVSIGFSNSLGIQLLILNVFHKYLGFSSFLFSFLLSFLLSLSAKTIKLGWIRNLLAGIVLSAYLLIESFVEHMNYNKVKQPEVPTSDDLLFNIDFGDIGFIIFIIWGGLFSILFSIILLYLYKKKRLALLLLLCSIASIIIYLY